MEPIELHAWVQYQKDDSKLENISWSELVQAVDALNSFQERFTIEDKIEEQPPNFQGNTFNPGGWIGTYKVGEQLVRVTPNPERISQKDFNEIRQQLVGWLEYIGPFFEALYGRYVNESLFKDLQCIAYSRHLIDYTEVLLSHFIPREIKTTQYLGNELRGRPFWKGIVQQRAKNSPLLVSRKVEFSLRTPHNLLLTRFHAEMLNEIRTLLNAQSGQSEFFRDWSTQAAYHQEFLNEGIWSGLLEESLDVDFLSGDTLEKARRTSRGEVVEIIDLWEAYVSNKSFLSDFGNRFDTALKPLSKIYELWCFKKLCELLEIDLNRVKRFPCAFPFRIGGNRYRLYYNTTAGLKKYSGLMSKIPVPIGRPDFVVESEKKIVCVMDAKCKTTKTLNTGDVQRFLSYILDYIFPKREEMKGIVFHLSKDRRIKKVSSGNCEIYLIPMTPTSYDKMEQEIREIIESITA